MIILEGITTEDFFEKIESIIDKKLEEILVQQNLKKDLTNRYITREEVSKLLRVSLPTLTEQCKIGLIKSYKIGNRVLFKGFEIDQSLVGKKHKRNLKN